MIRSKFATVPIPGESVTLNGTALISEAREEQTNLRGELSDVLDQLTYQALAAKDSEISDNVNNLSQKIPAGVFVDKGDKCQTTKNGNSQTSHHPAVPW